MQAGKETLWKYAPRRISRIRTRTKSPFNVAACLLHVACIASNLCEVKGAVRPTLSSPRVDSASSSGSPGVWMVTDLSPRLLLSLLLERWRSLRSLGEITHSLSGHASGNAMYFTRLYTIIGMFGGHTLSSALNSIIISFTKKCVKKCFVIIMSARKSVKMFSTSMGTF